MSPGGKKGGDFVLEGRHLVGLFLLLVVIFGVVFTLGYMLGRSRYDARLRAAILKSSEPAATASPDKPETAREEGPQTGILQHSADWDFYRSAEPNPSEDHLQPPKKKKTAPRPVHATKVLVPSARSAARSRPPSLGSPMIPRGTIMLQVAAVQRQSDAMALAQALQQKKFPAVVLTPATDRFYRVQVGPYANAKSAAAARRELQAKGFKSIVKR
jgi:cell division protein FtsN